ncbi:pectinesterase family protein [Alicyclobacillus sp.]|uniref:pectinesterase family protein n=1 Tax=Alicyclobacillus sp. TaxID=61169 RepID=UPI0025C6357A|nr:pectinesterase family protein [Alicyclobacillus sp.]MCL6515496.1 carbohydrate esterase [Alicyclobacillus sp.]
MAHRRRRDYAAAAVTAVTAITIPSIAMASPMSPDIPAEAVVETMEPQAGLLNTPHPEALERIPRDHILVVAADGSGNFTTLQAAIDQVPANSPARWLILVRPGIYRGTVHIPTSKPNITLAGTTGNPDDVVIVDSHANGLVNPDTGQPYGTSGSATVTVQADGFHAYNITFQNAFNPAAHPDVKNQQAVAVRTTGDRAIFVNDRFLGRQDTLYASLPSQEGISRQLYYNDYIEGTVDFVFGSATAIFDHCTLHALDHPGEAVTAASTPRSNPYGFLIVNSRITADPNLPEGSIYLGRPWPQYRTGSGADLTIDSAAQVTVMHTWITGAVAPQHWLDWSSPYFPWTSARYLEYLNTGPGADHALSDVPILTRAEAAQFTIQQYLGDWNPLSDITGA